MCNPTTLHLSWSTSQSLSAKEFQTCPSIKQSSIKQHLYTTTLWSQAVSSNLYLTPNRSNAIRKTGQEIFHGSTRRLAGPLRPTRESNFLSLIDKHFPVNNLLYKMFNRGTVKVSYSSMQNMKYIINNHNSKVLRSTEASEKNWNCSVKPNCPLDGACLERNVVYKATALPENRGPNTCRQDMENSRQDSVTISMHLTTRSMQQAQRFLNTYGS